MLARPAVPKWHDWEDFLTELTCLPMADVVSKVWFLSAPLVAWLGLPALGRVQRGKSYLFEGFEEASGT